MYKNYFRMQKEPFDTHPSTTLFYKSSSHQNGWNYLYHGIKNNEPVLLVAGEYGAGKTLLFLKLMKLLEINSNLASVCIPSPTYNFTMVLEKIFAELDITLDGIDSPDESRLQQAIYEHFEQKIGEKKKFIYVVVDDAQEFSHSFINKLRLLASYNFSGYFPIRIVLFSHPDLLKILKHKKMAAFGQRIKRVFLLKPLSIKETREYIYFRLIHSGAPGKPVFEDEAISLIQATSKGNPRLINNICDNCLLVASSGEFHDEETDTRAARTRESDKGNLINKRLVSKAVATGNLMGLDEIQEPVIPSPPPQEKSNHSFEPPPTSDTRRPASDDRRSVYDTRQDEAKAPYREEYNHRQKVEDDTIERDEGNKTGRENFRFRYGKLSIIIIFILIIMFLLFYLFNQNRSAKMYSLKNASEQIIKPMPEGTYPMPEGTYSMPESSYPFENLDMFNKKSKNNLSSNMVKRQDKLADKKKYQPIILVGNLM